jgi:hypothetical protein
MIHAGLTPEKWAEQSLMLQMANIGSEVFRAISWRERGYPDKGYAAGARAIELFNLTMSGDLPLHRRREVGRAKECFVDYYWGDNQYGSTAANLRSYFMVFTALAQRERGKY